MTSAVSIIQFKKPRHGRVPAVAALLAAALLLTGTSVRAQEDNPFARPGPPGGGTPPPSTSPLDSVEMRGVFTNLGTTYITLFDTANARSTILALGESANGLTVDDYQSEDDSVLVQSGGNSRRVKMKKAQIIAMAAPPPPPPPQPQPGRPAGPGAPPPVQGQPGAMGDEEVRNRMERVAQEIRRRREMRREIMERTQQQQQAPQGQPTPPQ